MSSYVSKNRLDFKPVLFIGALGIAGYLAYSYLSGGSQSYYGGYGGGSTSEGGSPIMAAGGYSAPTGTGATGTAGAALNAGLLPSIMADGYGANVQFTEPTKKQTTLSETTSDPTSLYAAVSAAGYSSLSQSDINAYNAALLQNIQAEDRTGGGSAQSALSFMGIGTGARYIATIPNTAGISNAGANLTSIVYDNGAYEVRDWRGNIVSSGSAGAYSPSSSGGGGSSSSGGSSSATKKETVNIVADKASAISKPFTTATLSTGGTYAAKSGTTYSYSGGGGSSSSSSKKSSVSSGGYAQGGAVRSNTTSSKYTG